MDNLQDKMKFDIKYKQEAGNTISPVEVSFNLISGAVNITHKDGIDGQLRRMYGRIQRKFDEAIENKGAVELDDSELDFIKKAIKEAKFPPNFSYNVMLLEDYFEEQEKKDAK